ENFDAGISIHAAGTSVSYKLRAYDRILPTWDESVRRSIENDMAKLPMCQDKWVHVRYQLAKGSVRIWVDDRLVTEKHDATLKTGGILRVALQPGTKLAELSVRALPATGANFEAIPLNGYVRDHALVKGAAVTGDSLPFGQTVTVQGVPFS